MEHRSGHTITVYAINKDPIIIDLGKDIHTVIPFQNNAFACALDLKNATKIVHIDPKTNKQTDLFFKPNKQIRNLLQDDHWGTIAEYTNGTVESIGARTGIAAELFKNLDAAQEIPTTSSSQPSSSSNL